MKRLLPKEFIAERSFRVEYLDGVQRAQLRASILGEIHYSPPAFAVGAAPGASVAMVQLQATPVVETWLSATPPRRGSANGFDFAHNDEVMFGVYTQAVDDADFETQVQALYESLRHIARAAGFPHLLRVWNYFPDIARARAGLDRYKRFCRARATALANLVAQAHTELPAASAVGTRGGNLVVYFLAGVAAGRQCENPRQVSAYRYPPQYGPRSPSFARATLTADGRLLISGTASIVGHESRHIGDVSAQLEETLENLRALIAAAARDKHAAFTGLEDLRQVKIYLRHAHDYELVARRLRTVLHPQAQCLYLLADICREELLLEIEGVAGRT